MNKTSKRILGNVVILAGLLALLCADDWVFQKFFHLPHWRWLLDNGVEIGFVATAFSLVCAELNEVNLDLISPEPLVFVSGQLQLVGVCVQALGVQTERGKAESGASRELAWPVLELWLALPFILVLAAGMIAWLLVVAPAQYFIVLLCGAPARMLAEAPFQLLVGRDERSYVSTKRIPRGAEIPAGYFVASLADKPVAATSLFATILLAVTGAFLGGG